MPIVVDTSVTMAWCFDDESTGETDAVLERVGLEGAVVPALWRLEVANVLLVAERRRRITEAQAARFVALLAQLPIRVDVTPSETASVLAAGRQHRLSACDASYLIVAERLALPMATLDQRLAAACRTAGVPLVIDG